MPLFGNDNGEVLRQILDQLGKIGESVAELKQQVNDQQRAIEQIRQDANAAITSGLTDNRAVIREGLASINDRFGDPLIHIGSDLGTIRASIRQLDERLKTRPAEQLAAPADAAAPEPQPQAPTVETRPEPAPAAEPEEAERPGLDFEILRAAAGIAHATIEAHRDTWAFLVQVAGNTRHFHIPGKVKDDDGFVSVRLSGPSLVAAIASLHRVATDTDDPITKAIAERIQGRITEAVEAVTDTTGHGTPVSIVIDDRPPVDGSSNGAVTAKKVVRKKPAA